MEGKSKYIMDDWLPGELAEEITNMTEEEKLSYLKNIVRKKLGENEKLFWSNIAKKILLNEELTNNIISEELQMY